MLMSPTLFNMFLNLATRGKGFDLHDGGIQATLTQADELIDASNKSGSEEKITFNKSHYSKPELLSLVFNGAKLK